MAKTKVLDLSFSFRVRVGAQGSAVAPGGKIKAIQEDGAEFTLQFEDGSSVTVQLADPGSSVAVRDDNNQVETPANQRAPAQIYDNGGGPSGGVGKIFLDFSECHAPGDRSNCK